MHPFTLVFLAALASSLLIQLWLSRRQLAYVRAHRDSVPEAFRDTIPLAAHEKAADYTYAKTRFGIVEQCAGSALLLAWTLGGGLELVDGWWRQTGYAPITIGVGFLISVFLLMAVLDLPLALYRTFVLEQRFGFNRTTPKLFIADTVKQGLLTLLLGAPLAWVMLWLMENAGGLWWVYVWAVWMGFSLLIMWAYPAFIAPLFNKFTALEDAELEHRIHELLGRSGFKANGIFVMDGSRRSSHGNAYFTGLGANKRIVFFDTLIKSLHPAEIEAVLAHELGHFKRKHTQKRLIVIAALSLAGFALLGWLINQPWFYTGLGMSRPSVHAALMLFALVVPVFAFFLQPIVAYYSRKHEFEADDFAARQTDAAELVRALVKLYRENASTLTPDPLYSAFHDSHPPAPVRVAHLSARTV